MSISLNIMSPPPDLVKKPSELGYTLDSLPMKFFIQCVLEMSHLLVYF